MPVVIAGRLFGPDLPDTGVEATAHWQGDALLVNDGIRTRHGDALRIHAAGFNHEQARIDWGSDGELFSFVVSDETAKAELLRRAPASRVGGIERTLAAPRLAKRRFAMLWLWLGTLAIAFLGFMLLSLPRASSKLAQLVPKEHEAMLGRVVLEQTRLTHRVFDQGPLVDAVRSVGSRLVVASTYEYRYYVSEDPQRNAFAAPGGLVVVTTGLLEAADSAEELAGVLAHEVAHVELRHATAGLLKSLGLRAAAGLLFGGIHPDAGNLFAHFTALKYSRDAEREADREGVRRLREAGIPAAAMLRMFEKLARSDNSAVGPTPEFLSTHPDMLERIDWLRQDLRRNPDSTTLPLTVDWSDVRRELERP